MSHTSSNYSIYKLVIDALEKDGAICNYLLKEYDEVGTQAGGTGNRYVFKRYNDKIINYHTILKVLTGEQRANISEAIPAIDFLHLENTGLMNTYPVTEDGRLDVTSIIAIPTDSTKTALDYIEEGDPYILNRALSGYDLANHFFSTSGPLITEVNVQASPWTGEKNFRYKGIKNKTIVNPLAPKETYTSIRLAPMYSLKATETVWIDMSFATDVDNSTDPQRVTESNYPSVALDATGACFVQRESGSSSGAYSICLEMEDICVILPDSSYSVDSTRILVFKSNAAAFEGDASPKESGMDSYKPYIFYVRHFNPSVTPNETAVDTYIPEYLKDSFLIERINKYGIIEKEYYSRASGLLNGIYCEPCEYSQSMDGSDVVSKWKLNNEVDIAAEKGISIAVGDKYFRGHILGRGRILDAPLKTTGAAEAGFEGKATYIYDKVAQNIAGLFKNIQVDINRWQQFQLRTLDTITNKADYSGERLSPAQKLDLLGNVDNKETSTLSTTEMLYPNKLKNKDGDAISYDEINEIIERCTTTKKWGARIKGDTITLDLATGDDGVAYDVVRINNGTILNWGLITKEDGHWSGGGDYQSDYNVEFFTRFVHRHRKEWQGFWPEAVYPLDNGCESLEIYVTSPINIFTKKSRANADVILLYPEYNKYLPENLFLFSRQDLGLEVYTGSSKATSDPTQTSKGLCSFYNATENCVISFKVERKVEFLPSKVKYADIYDNVDKGTFNGWHRHVSCRIGLPTINSNNTEDLFSGDPKNDCYIYVLSPLEISLENISIYDQKGDLVYLTGKDSQVSLVPMAYPSTYFPVTVRTDNEGNNEYIVSQTTKGTNLSKLEGSYIIPGIPAFNNPNELRSIRHRGSNLSMSIFADLFTTGLNSITSSILKQGVYKVLYNWPISTGDNGNRPSNPILLGDLKDTLAGIEELGPSITSLAEAGTFTIPVKGNLITSYSYKSQKSWEQFLDISSARISDKYKISSSSGSGVAGAVYECIKRVTRCTKELEDSDYWKNYWEELVQQELLWEEFLDLKSAEVGDAVLITDAPLDIPGAHVFMSFICKEAFEGVNDIDYWEALSELNTWQDLLKISNIPTGTGAVYQIKGKDLEGYTHRVYSYKKVSEALTFPTKNLADSNYWENYWSLKVGLTWKELLAKTSAKVDDVYYIEDADDSGEVGTYWACINPVSHSCNELPSNIYYYKNFWKKRAAATRKAITLPDVNNLYKRIDFDDDTYKKYEFSINITDYVKCSLLERAQIGTVYFKKKPDGTYAQVDVRAGASVAGYYKWPGSPSTGSGWAVKTTTATSSGTSYIALNETLEDLVKRRLGLININVTTSPLLKKRPSLQKIRAILESTFNDDANITRENCVALDNALGNNTQAFLNFGDPTSVRKTPDEVATLSEDLIGYIKQVLIESDKDIKTVREMQEKGKIDADLSIANAQIESDLEEEYDTTVGPEEEEKEQEAQEAHDEWEEWVNNNVYELYYTDNTCTTINTSAREASRLLSEIKNGKGTKAFTAWLRGWDALSLEDFISKYQLGNSNYQYEIVHHAVWVLFVGWVEWDTIPLKEYINERYHNEIIDIYNRFAKHTIQVKIASNPEPELYTPITKEEYVKSEKDNYAIYRVTYKKTHSAAGTYVYMLPNVPDIKQDCVAVSDAITIQNATITELTEDHITYSTSAANQEVIITYYITILKTATPQFYERETCVAAGEYPHYSALTINQIDQYFFNSSLFNIPEIFLSETDGAYEIQKDKVGLYIYSPEYTNNSWNSIRRSNKVYDQSLKGYFNGKSQKQEITVPLKTIDIATDILDGITDYVKLMLEGSTAGSGFVKYVKDQESNGKASGNQDGLYYKRWQILNNRLNRTNGSLAMAAMYLENKTNLDTPVDYQRGIASSYQNFIDILPIEDIEPLTYMKTEEATATTLKIPGKFYFQKELEAFAKEISSKCVLTCNKCSQQKSCPFYNEEEIVKLYCDECQTIDLWFKDNELDLLYYSDGDVDAAGKVINRSPYLVYKDVDGHTEELSHDLLQSAHLPYADIKTKKDLNNVITYEGITLEELRTKLGEQYPEFKEDTRNSIGWILGGRYGTVAYNSLRELENDAYPDLELPEYKYLYDAVFVDDDLSYISYGESLYDYPVSVDIVDETGTRKTYEGTTKLKIPRSLKIFRNANPDWDVYLASDDKTDPSGNEIVPLIYLGKVGDLTIAFDLQDDPIDKEIKKESDTKLYAKDVAQWSVNIAKGAHIYDPLDTQLDKNINKDQYWMQDIKKKITIDGKDRWLSLSGRKRASANYQEPVADPNSLDEAMVIAGRPLVNNYINFLRKVSIRMSDGHGNDLIPWVKDGSGLDVETQKSILPMMKTKLRLVVVKTK